MRKRLSYGLMLCAVFALLMTALTGCAPETGSGVCGEALSWELSENGVLTISGVGQMYDRENCTFIGNEDIYAAAHTIVLEEGVTGIGAGVFADFWNLSEIRIPQSVTSIADAALPMSGMAQIEISENLLDIGTCVFRGPVRVHVSENNPNYASDETGALYDKGKTVLLHVPGTTQGKFVIPDTVLHIGQEAFANCGELTEIVIPDSVQKIDDFAFLRCEGLTSIEIPASVESFGAYLFAECSNLTGIWVDAQNPNYASDNRGVLFNKEMTELIKAPGKIRGVYEIPKTVTSILHNAFEGCDKLTGVTLQSKLSQIGAGAFADCVALNEIIIPDGVKLLDEGVFRGCSGLGTITFEGDVPAYVLDALADVTATVYYPRNYESWSKEELPDNGGMISWLPYGDIATGWSGDVQWKLTEKGELIFFGKGKMKNYEYNGGQPWAKYADQIKTVVVEKGITAVGSGAFRGLTKLESVTLPEWGLTKIGEAAFYGCTALKQITVPEGVYTIWPYTFKNCSALEKVKLPKTLIKIDRGAFEKCTALSYFYIPTNVEIIAEWSFKGCTGLKEVDMSWADITEIREGTFKNCTRLTIIHFPVTIEKLGDSAFYKVGANKITIPATVTKVGAWCFARSSLKSVTFQGKAPKIGEGAFNKVTLTAYYPKGNGSWTTAVMQNYGGTITWKAN